MEPSLNKTDNCLRPLGFGAKQYIPMYVTSFSSISYYSNVRLISKIELERIFQSIILDIHAILNYCLNFYLE